MKGIKLPPVQAPRFTRMNLDVDVRGLQAGEYRTLTNGINIGPLGNSGLDGVISNIVGNELIENTDLETTSKVIGFLEDTAKSRCFYAVYHSGGNHTIYQYTMDGGAPSIVLRTNVFDFSIDDFVSMDILGDLLIITNNSDEIREINVEKALTGTYTSPSRETISLIKKAPAFPLLLSEVSGSARYSYSGYQFYYRFIYEDGQPSVWGSLSKIYSTRTPNTTQSTTLRITVPAETVPNTVIRKEFAFRLAKSNEFVIYRTEIVGLFSSTHDFIDEIVGETIPDSDSFKWFEPIPKASKGVRWMKNRLFLFNNLIGYTRQWNKDYSSVFGIIATIINPTYPAIGPLYTNPDDYYTFKSNSRFKLGILFTDWAGRHVGCFSDPSMVISIPDFNFSNWSGYRITWDMGGASPQFVYIPTWATNWQFVRTKCLTKSFFIQGIAPDVMYYKKDDVGAYVFSKTIIPDAEGVAIDLSNLTKSTIGYSFQQGDFVRLYDISSTLRFDSRIYYQDGKHIFIKGSSNKVTLSATAPDLFYYEIYTPLSGPLTETFYEIGEKYEIGDPGTGTRNFGSVQTGTLRGDTYMKERQWAAYNPAGYSATDPYSNKFNTFSAIVNHQAMNPSDDFFTDWIQDIGRAVQDTTSVNEVRLNTNIRFGRPYNNVASTPQYNVFDALDDQQLPIENGAGTALAEAGEVLVAVHEGGATSVYVGQGFVSTSNGNNFLTKTDQVIGDFRKYLEKAGCINPSSIVTRNGHVYWVDIKNGCVVRRSQDGITRISDYGVRSFFANLCRVFRELINPEFRRIVAGWDPKYECYVISFQNLGDPAAGPVVTMYFHEKSNSWVCFAGCFPEFFGTLGSRQIHFKEGSLWIQSNNISFNNWFGNQFYRALNIEIGANSEEKIWTGIEVDIDSIYTPSTPSTLLKLIALTGWTDSSTVLPSPAPVYAGSTITKTGWATGTIQGDMPLVIPPGMTVKMSMKMVVTNNHVSASTIIGLAATLGSGGQAQPAVNVNAGETIEKAFAFEFINDDVVDSTTFGINVNKGGFSDDVDIALTFAVGAVLYTTLPSNEDVVLLYHTNGGALQTKINVRDFVQRSSAWFSSFFGYVSDPNFAEGTESKYKSSQKVRGQSAYITINGRNTEINTMKSITVFYETSMLSYM